MKSVLARWRTSKWMDPVIGGAGAVVLWKTDALDGDAGTLLQVAGGLGVGLIAFVVTPVAILLSITGGGRFRSFDRRQRPNILRAMAWAFTVSLALMLVCLVGAAAVATSSADTLRLVVVAVGIASILASARLFWFFYAALGVKQADEDAPLASDQLLR